MQCIYAIVVSEGEKENLSFGEILSVFLDSMDVIISLSNGEKGVIHMTQFLDGDIRKRIQDLCTVKGRKQSELARIAGMNESTFSRFMSGKTQTLKPEALIRIARELEVSTDFLLGIVKVPDRTNFQISELGLSVQAARNLCSGKLDTDVVSRLLEAPNFAAVLRMVRQYLGGQLAAGIAANNALFDKVAGMLWDEEIPEGANQVLLNKMNPHSVLNACTKAFAETLKGIQEDIKLEVAAEKLTAEEYEKMRTVLVRKKSGHYKAPTPEQLADTILASIAGQTVLRNESLKQLRFVLIL